MPLTRTKLLRPAVRLVSFGAVCAVLDGCVDEPTSARRTAAAPVARPLHSVSPEPNSPFGLVLHRVANAGVLSDLMKAAEGSGARWARITFYRWELDPNSQGTVAATGTAYRATVDSLTARGIQVYGTIEYNQSASEASNPAAMNAWRSFVQQLDQAFPAVHYWAIGNEANVNPPYNDPAIYDVYLGAAANAVPSKVTIGEPTLGYAGYANWISSRLNVLKQRGITPGMIPVHRYLDHGYSGHPNTVAAQLTDLQNASTAASQVYGTGVPIWLTEFGLNNAASAQTFSRADRDSITISLIAEVYRALQNGAVSNWQKAFYYRLWDGADADSAYSMLSAVQVSGAFIRRDAWHMYRQVALHGGGDWQPVVRWWRQWDGKWGTDPNESTAGGYSLVSRNSWSASNYQYGTTESGVVPGWHALVRCVYADPTYSDMHTVSQDWGCSEYGRFGSFQVAYGLVSDVRRDGLGLVPLFRFYNAQFSDFVATTDSAEAARLKTTAGWAPFPVLGYVWAANYTP